MDTIFTTANPMNKKASKHLLVANLTGCAREYQDHIQQSVEAFVQCMHDRKESSPIDFSDWAFFWGFDVTYAILFGHSFGFMESHGDFNGMINAFTKVTRYAILLGQVPEWCPLFLGNDRFMTFMRRFQSFPDPTQLFLQVRTHHGYRCVGSIGTHRTSSTGSKLTVSNTTTAVRPFYAESLGAKTAK